MSEAVDALSLLRQYVSGKKKIVEEDDKIIFGNLAYSKDVQTNYMIYGAGKDGKSKQYYTLECINFLLNNVELQHATYIKKANQKQVDCVTRMDRKELLSYLEGETQTNQSIDKNAPIEITMQRPIQLNKQQQQQFHHLHQQQNHHQQSSLQASKKQKLNDDDISLNSHNSSLNSIHNALAPAQTNIIQMKEKIAKKFDSNTVTISDNITALSEQLTAEKINSIKTKLVAKKRKQVNDSDDFPSTASSSALGGGVLGGNAQQQQELSLDLVDLTKEILNRERIWRNRITILESNGKHFDKNIFAILQSIQGKMDNKMGSGFDTQSLTANTTNAIGGVLQANVLTSGGAGGATQLTQQQQSNSKSKTIGYNRFDQEIYGGKDETGGFSIDTKRTYQYNGAISINEASKTPTQQQTQTQNTSKQQILSSSTQVANKTKINRASMRPIIIVPAARNALVTLFNVIDILQDLKYISSDDKRKSAPQNSAKDSEIVMRKREDGKSLQFKVIDNISKLTTEDWDRVVAVFAQGPLWQFKEWPWEGNPVEIFSRIKAFHLKWSGIPLDTNIAKWSVSVIELDQHKRHLDRARLLGFWDELDKFMIKNKPHLY